MTGNICEIVIWEDYNIIYQKSEYGALFMHVVATNAYHSVGSPFCAESMDYLVYNMKRVYLATAGGFTL